MKKIKMHHVHMAMIVVWVLLSIPSLIWWKDSVLWVIVISIYANIVGHLSGFSAARADEEARRQKKEQAQ